jgi:hypothetical protein
MIEGLEFESHYGQEFSNLHVIHTASGAYPEFYQMGTAMGDWGGGTFSRGKVAEAWSWQLTFNEEANKSWIYTATPSIRFHDVMFN